MVTSADHKEVRINKYIAERLGLARREVDDAIRDGLVTVDGEVAVIGTRVDNTNEVCYNGEIVPKEPNFTYLLMNKPFGYVCSRKMQGEVPTIYSLLPDEFIRLKTVGRLDKNSRGLILLSDDGDLAFRLTHPRFQKHKKYIVLIDRPLSPMHQQMISDFGIALMDGNSQLPLTEYDGSTEIFTELRGNGEDVIPGQPIMARTAWYVEMTEGRNRQIRRTFSTLGYQVRFLQRIQFGPFTLDDDLEDGEYREVTL